MGEQIPRKRPSMILAISTVCYLQGRRKIKGCGQEFYTAERKKELIPFATAWMELESIMLSEISQAVRDNTI